MKTLTEEQKKALQKYRAIENESNILSSAQKICGNRNLFDREISQYSEKLHLLCQIFGLELFEVEEQNAMKRYLLFLWETHEACGGMNDCIGIFDTFEEATNAFQIWLKEVDNEGFQNLHNAEIYDMLENKTVNIFEITRKGNL